MGDQSGAIHIWDLKTDHNEQLIPEPEVSITSAHIDPDASYMAAVNSTVSPGEGGWLVPSLYLLCSPQGGFFPRCPSGPFLSAILGSSSGPVTKARNLGVTFQGSNLSPHGS